MGKSILTSIVSIVAFAGVLAHAKPPTNFASLVGVWNNANPATKSIVRVIVRRTLTGISVQPFGACSPTPCNHGIILAKSFSPGVVSAQAVGFDANKNFGFKSTAYNGILQGNVLFLLTQDTFAAADNRFNYTVMERFVRVAASVSDEAATQDLTPGSRGDLE